ncbi:MAG: ArsR family transcriptional regulator [Candidatus Thermoplasmatota archaeon]|nr:ArsR family transcriptional regulator [Candidatus Thermoplasmatota archaeon]
MNKTEESVFDENEKEIVNLLINLGLSKNVSKTLVFLFRVKETIPVSIERNMDLRQPEVSVALKKLEEKGWVEKRNIKRGTRGRPMSSYKLSLSPEKIMDFLEEKKFDEIKKIKENVEKIRGIIEKNEGDNN